VEVSGGTCSDGSIRKSLSVVGQGPGHVYCCGWRQTGILKWYILLGNARCAQREKNCTHSHCYSKAEVERKAQAAGTVQQYCCSQIQEMGENCIMSFMSSAANRILEAKTKET
jgi:hypothetical protein